MDGACSCRYLNVPDDDLIKTGIVRLTGGKDELGCHLITFQSQKQSIFIQLDYATLVQSMCNIITYYDCPLISFLVNLQQSSPLFLEHFVEVIIQVQTKLVGCEIKRLYIVKPEQKSSQKSLRKLLRRKETKKKLCVQVITVKNFDELHQYIKVKNLTPDFGGVLAHDHVAWINVQKPLNEFYLLVDRVALVTPDIVDQIRALSSDGGRSSSAKPTTGHGLSKRLQKAENEKDALLRQCALIKTLEEGQRLHSYFKDPSFNEYFRALSKTPLLELDKVKFHKFYRKALSIKNKVENSWQDVVSRLQLTSREQRLHENLSECSTWIVNYGLPYLKRMPVRSVTLNEAIQQMTSFENGFYKQTKDVLKKARVTMKEVHDCQRTFGSNSLSLQTFADNLSSLTDNLKVKLEERMDLYKKQRAFMEVFKKAEVWYEKARDFWPSRLEPSSHRGNLYLSPSSFTDISQPEYELELFLERYPPLTSKERQTLTDYLENVADVELRNRARLLGNRCQEIEKILRTRETHFIDTSNEEWVSEVDMSHGPADTAKISENSERCESQNAVDKRQLSGLDKHHLLSSTSRRLHSSSARAHDHRPQPGKRRTERWSPEGNLLNSTTLHNNNNDNNNNNTPILTSEMATSFSQCSRSSLAGEHLSETGNQWAKESRLMNLRRRLKNQELLYEQLMIEEELREMDEVRDGRSSEGFGVLKSEMNDSLNSSMKCGEQSDLTKSPDYGNSYLAALNSVNGLSTKLPSSNTTANNKLKASVTPDHFDLCRKDVVGSTSLPRYHGYRRETVEPTSLLGHRLVHEAIATGQQRPASNYMSSFDSELPDDIQEKLRIARESEMHWIRVKDEQRARLGHVIRDVSTRKEVEEVYFNAQLKLCRLRRVIAELNKSRTSLCGMAINDSGTVPVEKFTIDHSLNFPGCLGPCRTYVKDNVTDKYELNMVGSQPSNENESENESEQIFGMIEEKDQKNTNDINDHLEDFKLPVGCGEYEKLPLENLLPAQKPKTPLSMGVGAESEEDEEESSDEFEDEEEDELMILRSDSSSGRRSQEELRDSLREEQEKLEEMFRQQKERFRKEQEELKQEADRIKDWETKKQLEGQGQKSEEVEVDMVGMNYTREFLKLEKEMLKQGENSKTEEQHEQQKKEEQEELLRLLQAQNQQRQVEEYQLQEKVQGKQKEITESREGDLLIQVNRLPCDVMNDTVTASLFSINQNLDDSNRNSTNKLDQIFVSNDDSDQETIEEIETELIRILREERSEDKEDKLTDWGTEVKEEEKGQKEMNSELRLHEVGKNLNLCKVAAANVLEESNDVELMNQMIDDLMINDQNDISQEDKTSENVDHFKFKTFEPNTLGYSAKTNSHKRRTDLDTNFDVTANRKKFKDDHLLAVDLLPGKNQQLENKGVPKDDEVDIRTPVTEQSTQGKDLTSGSRYPGLSDELIERIVENNEEVRGNSLNNVLGDKVEYGQGKSMGINEITKDSEVVYQKSGGNGDNSGSLLDTETVDDMDNTSLISGTTGDNGRYLEEEEGLSIYVNFNIDLAGDVKVCEDDDLSLIDLIRGSDSPSESDLSKESLEEVEVVIEQAEADQDTNGNLVFSGSQGEPSVELVGGEDRDNQGNGRVLEENGNLVHDRSDVEGENGSVGSTVLNEIAVDKESLQATVDCDRSVGNSLSNLEKVIDLKNTTVTYGIAEENGKLHEISRDNTNESIREEQHSSSYSETDEESEEDFGTVLEDIEEEGSEYEEPMDERGIQALENCAEHKMEGDPISLESSTSAPCSARFTNEKINKHVVTANAFSSSIIIDPGSGYCKAGFSVDDKPRLVLPSVVGKPQPHEVTAGRYKDHYVGYDASSLRRVLTLHHPVERGVVSDWDLVEKMLEYVYDELRCESDQYPVLLSEPPLNPKLNREQMIQMMFETFHVPAAYICVQAVLALFATGKSTGLVYDSGHGASHCIPVYEGYALPHAMKIVDLAGRDLTMCLGRMLRDRGTTLQTSAELEIVQEMKEKLCYVVVDYENERKAYSTGQRQDIPYKLPDGQTIMIGSERFRCPEVLFTPSIIGLALDGIHEIIYKTVLQSTIDIRSTLLKNIVLSGGTTMLPGLARRLHVELSQLLGTKSPDAIHIEAAEERNILAWQGGSMLSKLSNFSSMWITEQEYEEFGPAIVHKKCV